MTNDEPLAYFITWTIYGTFLQGDQRWWRKKRCGSQAPQPLLAKWHGDRLKYDVILLNDEQRAIVETETGRHCDHRGWRLWICNARTNHIHVVVTASNYSGRIVRDQLKANCTRGLREQFDIFLDRPIWTVGGDWECINDEDALDRAVIYAGDAQERMEHK